MTKLRNMVGAFAIMYILIILVVTSWSGFKDGYGVTEGNLKDGENIFQKLKGLGVIEGLNQLTIGIQDLGKLSNPLDLLGALAISASGSLQVIGGIITFPIEIFGVVTGFYDNIIPGAIETLIGFLATISVGFILISAKMGYEL